MSTESNIKSKASLPSSSSPQRGLRGRWSDDHFTLLWLAITIVLSIITVISPGGYRLPLWPPLYAAVLGVASNGIFQWSWFFSRGLLHFPVTKVSRYSTLFRLIIFNSGVVALFIAMWMSNVALSVVATVLMCVAGIHQGAVLAIQTHRSSNRYAPLVRYYVFSFLLFVLSCVIGEVLTIEMIAPAPPQWLIDSADAIAVLHSILGVGGWLGLAILGTVVNLGLSMLHARQESTALRSAANSLPLQLSGIAVASIGALANYPWVLSAGIIIFIVAAWWGILHPLAKSFRLRKRSSHAVWSLLMGLVWMFILLAIFAVRVVFYADMTVVRNAVIAGLMIFVAAGVGQIFIASLEYLVPVAIGGGPSVQRYGDLKVSWKWPVRFAVRNAALILLIFTQYAGVEEEMVTTSLVLLILASYALDVALVGAGAHIQLRAKRHKIEKLNDNRSTNRQKEMGDE